MGSSNAERDIPRYIANYRRGELPVERLITRDRITRMKTLVRDYRFLRHGIVAACLLSIGCASSPIESTAPIPDRYRESNLPEPDVALSIAGLGPCENSPDRTLHLNSREPVTLLVHGCYGSAGSFHTLSRVLAFHGQQSACFSYNDRDSLTQSAAEFTAALENLTAQLPRTAVTIIGHSQGGLIARKALTNERLDPVGTDARLELVTVSAPFSGIQASRTCANPLLRALTFGLHDLVCKLLTGDKWYEITPASDFIRKPGTLLDSVERYLLVTTDETDSCRRYDSDGNCAQDDYVFGLDEQELPPVASGAQPRKIEIRAGHVEVVGETGVVPDKLIRVLQQQGYMRTTEASRAAELQALLASWYGLDPNHENRR